VNSETIWHCSKCLGTHITQEYHIMMPVNAPPQTDHISLLYSGEYIDFYWCETCKEQRDALDFITGEEADATHV